MGYEKTVWKTGDVVTFEKLNNLENGVADAGDYIITVPLSDEDFSTLNGGGMVTASLSEQVYQNIKTAYNAGRMLSVCLSLEQQSMVGMLSEIYVPCVLTLGEKQNNEKIPTAFQFVKTIMMTPNNNSNTRFMATTVRVLLSNSPDSDNLIVNILSMPFIIETIPIEENS